MDVVELNRRRSKLVTELRADAKTISAFTGRAAFSEQTLNALLKVPRHEFVPNHLLHRAYDNCALPLARGQTISQPLIVALMTDVLEIQPNHKILEIGTGSGYQTAVLAELAEEVFSIEVLPELATKAHRKLNALGVENVRLRSGNGHLGWPEQAPFDGVIITAAARKTPATLQYMMKLGGAMVIPLGDPRGHQTLYLFNRIADEQWQKKELLAVSFVPLID